MEMIERFVLITYGRTSELIRAIDAMKQMFAKKYCSLVENISPTEAALE